MKRFRFVTLCALAMLAGCANLNVRTSKSYVCAPHPYYCTASVWSDCVCAPYYAMGGNAPDPSGGIWYAFATLTWPFWLVDEVAEVALDTVFLPVDGIYALCRDKPKQTQGEVEKVEEAR